MIGARTPGFDFSGVVTDTHPGDTHALTVGDCVFGMIRHLPDKHHGTCAEYILV